MRSDYKSARAGLKAHPQVRGGRLYNETAKELIQQQPNLNDIIEKRRNNYE